MRVTTSKAILPIAGMIASAGMLLTAGCRTVVSPLSRFEFRQPHMGTLFTITLYAPDEATARVASDAAFARIAVLNSAMTDYDPESELMQLCKTPVGRPVRVSPDLFEVLRRGQQLAELSDGAFDVTIGPVVRQWRRARRSGVLPDAEQLAHAHRAVGWRKLKLDEQTQSATLLAPNMQLDLGGIAKGVSADLALATLKQNGCASALVAASGDIAAGDAPPGRRGWRVSIGLPGASPAQNAGSSERAGPVLDAPFARSLLLRNAAVSTSGDAEQFVELDGVRYSHIVNPRTGVGLTNQLQVTVIARHAADTDAFATTVCVLGVERGLRLVETQSGMAALILRKSGGKWEAVESRRMRSIPRVE